MIHKPVLTKEVLEYLNPKPNENFIDGTVGQGGHTLLLLEKIAPNGKVLGIDLDAGQIQNSRSALTAYTDRTILVHDSYSNIKEIVQKNNFKPVNGILLDLGYSSWQLEQSAKGFSFLKDEALDMRYQSEITNDKLQIPNNLTAAKIINEYPENEIERILEEYGEENFAKQIAKAIVRQREIRKIESTFQLKEIIEKTVRTGGNIHSATRSFQALRIAVNDELGNLQKALPNALSVLSSGGRLVVISFHSLEDRIVKNFFKEQEQQGIANIVTKKPVMAQLGEVSQNPRARSAKLRAIIKI